MTRWPIAVGESRAVVHIRGGKSLPGQVRVETDICRIALVVIESEAARTGVEVGQPAIDRAESVGSLIGIGHMGLTETPKLRGTNGEFIALNQRSIDRQG